jgi:hypothetical protein
VGKKIRAPKAGFSGMECGPKTYGPKMLPRERRLTPAECHRSSAVPWRPQMYPGIVQMHPSVLMKLGVLVCPNILM